MFTFVLCGLPLLLSQASALAFSFNYFEKIITPLEKIVRVLQ